MAHNVLIVDDSALTRKAIARIISMTGIEVAEVFEAANGVEALELLDGEQVDLVLADLNMPQMGGVELVTRMKQDQDLADIPVVVVSTESSVTRIKELVVQGIKDYLHKPFTPEEFRAIFAKNIGV